MIDTQSVIRILLTIPLAALLGAGLPDFPAALADEQPKVEQECLSYDSACENAPLFVVKPSSGEERACLYKQTQPCPKDKPRGSRQICTDDYNTSPQTRARRCGEGSCGISTAASTKVLPLARQQS